MKIKTKDIVLIGLFVALGIILPMAFHAVGTDLGRMFSPIHIPALVAGALMGPVPGLLVGILSVLASSLFTSMPPFPYAFVMMAEVGSYGLFAGLFGKFLTKDALGTFVSTALAMVAGRIVYGFAQYIFNSAVKGEAYSIGVWVTSMFVTKIPTLVLHIILVPIVILLLRKYVRDFD